MKSIFLAGGTVGFLVATLSGWEADRAPGSILLDAMFGAIIGGYLFRWFWSVLIRGMRETYVARQQAAETAAETKKKN